MMVRRRITTDRSRRRPDGPNASKRPDSGGGGWRQSRGFSIFSSFTPQNPFFLPEEEGGSGEERLDPLYDSDREEGDGDDFEARLGGKGGGGDGG